MSRSDRGSAIVPALSLLSLLGLLATLSLMGSGAELVLATRLARERAGLYAAESALERTRYELEHAGPAELPDATFAAPWPDPGLPVRSWREDGWELTGAVRLLPDARDADGDPATAAVLFNRAFGYAGSPLATGGYPVFQVIAAAQGGESRQAVVAEVAPVTCAPEVAAAWTAGGPLEISGDARVSGLAHGADGSVLDGVASLPAVVSRGAVSLAEGASAEGLHDEGGSPVVSDGGRGVPTDALAALRAGSSLAALGELPPPGEGNPDGLLWSRGDYAGPLDGRGILVVHNPRFDPVRYEASRILIEEGRVTPAWDPAYSHLDAAHQPARLESLRGGTFRGVVVADALGACEQPFTLAGALITLARSPARIVARGALRVVYTPGAVERAGRGPLRFLAGFKPLPGTRERLP